MHSREHHDACIGYVRGVCVTCYASRLGMPNLCNITLSLTTPVAQRYLDNYKASFRRCLQFGRDVARNALALLVDRFAQRGWVLGDGEANISNLFRERNVSAYLN